MRILVTGANGFVGSALVKRLKQEGKEVVETAQHAVELAIDLKNAAQVQALIEKIRPTIVVHCGAYVDLSRTFEANKKCIDVNVLGTLNLLEALRNYPPERVLFMSTEEVYGKGQTPYKEEQTTFPPSGYAVSKAAGEELSKIYAKDINFELVLLRVGTMYGPGDRAHRLIPDTIIKAVNGEDILLNSGKKKRDYVYIDDVTAALTLSLKNELHSLTETINIGGGVSYTLIDVVTMIIQKLGSSSKIILGAVPDRAGESDIWEMDISKAKHLLSWEPQTSLSEGIDQTIAYFKK